MILSPIRLIPPFCFWGGSTSCRPILYGGERGENVALNQKQKSFVAEYLVDLNATKAAVRAGYSEKTSYSIGQRLLKNVEIQKAIQDAMSEREERTQITQDRVLQEYARIAFFDPRNLFDNRGCPLNISDIDDDTAAAIAGIEVIEGVNLESGCLTRKYKIVNKLGALDSLAKHLGMFDARQEVEQNNEPDALSKSLEDMGKELTGD